MRTSSRYEDAASSRLGAVLLLAIGFPLVVGGCAGRHVKSKPFPWSTFAYTRPVTPAAVTEQVDNSDLLADVGPEVEPPPSPLVLARAVPTRPRVAAAPASSNETSNKADVPQIAPQLSVGEAN